MSLSLSGRLGLSVNSARYDNYIEIIRRNKWRMNNVFGQIKNSIKDMALCEKDFAYTTLDSFTIISDIVSEANGIKNSHIENKDMVINKLLLDEAVKESEKIANDIFNEIIKDINKDRRELGYIRALTIDKITKSIPVFILWELDQYF